MNIFNDNNNTISLEEDESFNRPINKNDKNKNIKKEKTSNSFFGTIINSVSKIGQGLKNIMSMKITYEDEDDNNHNLYNQVCNRFNTNEEISLIDAPSFMEESNLDIQNNEKNESNIMMISKNEMNSNDINNYNNDKNQIQSFKNSFKEREGIINNNIIQNEESKLRIKSKLLNKKRVNDKRIENILGDDEEEKNEDENLNINININSNEKQLTNKNKAENSLNSTKLNMNKNNSNISYNTFRKNKGNNTSMMSISMRSFEDIKNEISKRREENLHFVQNLQKRNGLNYDSNKERQMREKILDEYYKEKARRIAEGKLKLEREKIKREEEFKKLKIKKESGFKYSSIQKKPHILSETKSTEIFFKSNEKTINNNNNKTINIPQLKDKKQPNAFPKANIVSPLNITFGSNNPVQNEEIKVEKNNLFQDNKSVDNKDVNKKIDQPNSNGIQPSFQSSITKKEEKKTEKEIESKPKTGLFHNIDNMHNSSSGNIENTYKIVNESKPIENKQNSHLFSSNNKGENENIIDNKKESIFSKVIVQQTKEEKNQMNNQIKQENFFDSSNNLILQNNEKKSSNPQINNEIKGLFDQNNQVSKAINNQQIFSSNNEGNSLANVKTNPFLMHNNINQGNSSFGVKNENNIQNSNYSGLFQGIQFGGNNGNNLFGK